MSRSKAKATPEWSYVAEPATCHDCGKPCYLRDAHGVRRHKVCADAKLAATLTKPRPGAVRAADHATSRESARRVAGRTGSQRARLLAAYASAPAAGYTDEEAAQAAGLPERACWWKRCGELRDADLIGWTGATRDSPTSGGAQGVCAITELGRTIAREVAADEHGESTR